MVITETRLRHLLSVVHHSHFGRAAESLNISQPALTKSIHGLESALGVRLLDRERGGVVLTEFGELVLQHGTDLVRNQNEMLREIRLLASLDTGRIHVLLGPYPSVVSGYEGIARLLSRHPNLTVSVRVEDWRGVIEAIEAKKVDFGVAELSGQESASRFEVELVGEHLGRLFCRPGHPILEKNPITVTELTTYPWAGTRLPPRVAQYLPSKPCRAGHLDLMTGDFVPAVEFNVPMHLGAFVKRSDLLVLASLALMEAELNAGTVVPVPGPAFKSRYGFIHLKARSLAPAARACMQEIRAVEAEFAKREIRLTRRYTKHL